MNAQQVYEQVLQQGHDRGFQLGTETSLRRTLIEAYTLRFGTPPERVIAAVNACHNTAQLHAWMPAFITAGAEEIHTALNTTGTPSTPA